MQAEQHDLHPMHSQSVLACTGVTLAAPGALHTKQTIRFPSASPVSVSSRVLQVPAKLTRDLVPRVQPQSCFLALKAASCNSHEKTEKEVKKREGLTGLPSIPEEPYFTPYLLPDCPLGQQLCSANTLGQMGSSNSGFYNLCHLQTIPFLP